MDNIKLNNKNISNEKFENNSRNEIAMIKRKDAFINSKFNILQSLPYFSKINLMKKRFILIQKNINSEKIIKVNSNQRKHTTMSKILKKNISIYKTNKDMINSTSIIKQIYPNNQEMNHKNSVSTAFTPNSQKKSMLNFEDAFNRVKLNSINTVKQIRIILPTKNYRSEHSRNFQRDNRKTSYEIEFWIKQSNLKENKKIFSHSRTKTELNNHHNI